MTILLLVPSPVDKRWPSIWTWPERLFLRHPTPIAILFIGLYAISLAFLAAALASVPILSVSTSIAITALLALGTLTLAYAAVLQALLAGRTRRASVTPQLDIEFSRLMVSPSSGVERWQPIDGGEFMIDIPPSPNDRFRFVLRNFGPGTAVRVKVVSRQWWPTRATLDVGLQPTGFVTSPPLAWSFHADSLSLQLGGEREFPIELMVRDNRPSEDRMLPYRILKQVVVTAEGIDIEGRKIKAPPIGLVHSQLIDTMPGGATTVWALISPDFATALAYPIPPEVDGDFASRLPRATS